MNCSEHLRTSHGKKKTKPLIQRWVLPAPVLSWPVQCADINKNEQTMWKKTGRAAGIREERQLQRASRFTSAPACWHFNRIHKTSEVGQWLSVLFQRQRGRVRSASEGSALLSARFGPVPLRRDFWEPEIIWNLRATSLCKPILSR